MLNVYMLIWSLNVKITDPLVVAAGSALSKSPHGKSRELWATSGSHFPDVSFFSPKGTIGPVLIGRGVLAELCLGESSSREEKFDV